MSEAARILVVDDEPDIVELVSYHLGRAGYRVETAPDGEEALRRLRSPGGGGYDLVVLDLMLPGIQGMELCRLLRKNPDTLALPVIMLTARGQEPDRLEGFDAGADDYVQKPFSPRELLARVKAILRRSRGIAPSAAATGGPPEGPKPREEEPVTVGELELHPESYRVVKAGEPVELSATEFRLLLFLARRQGRIMSRGQLLDALWDDNVFVEPRTIDVHIRRLRKKIERDAGKPRLLKTRRGVGYYLANPSEEEGGS